MGMVKRSRTGTRRTTLAVLDILKNSTSRSNPVSIAELVKRLNAEYGIHTHRDSVKAILDDLKAYYPEPDQICCDQSGDGRTYQFNYYYQTELPETLQENIQKLDLVMRKNKNSQKSERRISFMFCGYGADHEVHPIKRWHNILPARIVQAYGHYYLIGFFAGSWETAHFRIDLMRQILEEDPKEITLSDKNAQLDAFHKVLEDDYLSSHLYMSFEHGEAPERIRLRVKKIKGKPDASLTFLQDVFGSNWHPVSGTETDEQIEVWVKCLPYAIKLFVRQYIDRVRVLEPVKVAEQVEQALREEFEAYFSDETGEKS